MTLVHPDSMSSSKSVLAPYPKVRWQGRTTLHIAHSFIRNHWSSSSLRNLSGPTLKAVEEETTRGVRIVYPLHDMFIFNRKDNIGSIIFGRNISDKLFGFMKISRIPLVVASFFSASYAVSTQLGFVSYSHYFYLVSILLNGFLSLPILYFCNTNVVRRLCDRFEVQFAGLNLLGMIMGLLFLFENKEIALYHCFVYTMVGTTIIFLDAAFDRDIKYLYLLHHFIAISMLLSLRITLSQRYFIATEMKTTISSASFPMLHFVMRCITSMLLLCAARVVILLQFPSFYVSLKGPLKIAKPSKNLRMVLQRSHRNVDDLLELKPTAGCPTVYALMNVRKPFEYQLRDTIGRTLLGPDLADKYLYIIIQRLCTASFFVTVIPCNWYLISMMLEPPRLLSWVDILISALMIQYVFTSILFCNASLLKLVCQSLEIYLVILPCTFVGIVLLYLTYGTNFVIVPITTLLLNLNFVLEDVHIHRKMTSFLALLYGIYQCVLLYVGIEFDLFHLEDVILEIPGLPGSLFAMCQGWLATSLVILLRYLYQLLRHPDCFLFIKSPMQSNKVTEYTARAIKATTANYMMQNEVKIMSFKERDQVEDEAAMESN